MEKWLPIISITINGSILIAGYAFIRKMTRLEFQIEMMWKFFVREFGPRARIGIDRTPTIEEE